MTFPALTHAHVRIRCTCRHTSSTQMPLFASSMNGNRGKEQEIHARATCDRPPCVRACVRACVRSCERGFAENCAQQAMTTCSLSQSSGPRTATSRRCDGSPDTWHWTSPLPVGPKSCRASAARSASFGLKHGPVRTPATRAYTAAPSCRRVHPRAPPS